MNKKKIIVVLLLLIVMLSLSATSASAIILDGPRDHCKTIFGGIFDPATKNCYWKQNPPMANMCYPLWDKAVWNTTFDAYTFGGCIDLRNFSTSTFLGGSFTFLTGGASFSYDPGTCDGKCKVVTSGITGDAKAALGDLPGKVIGKVYVQILDLEGNPTTGNFKLCLKAKNAKNPAFFRYTSSGWQYFGGFWSGKKFCMAGTMGGNYVLVDIKD